MKRENYIPDEEVVKRVIAAVKIELEKKKAMELPAVIYDPKTKVIYHEYSNGTRVKVGKPMRKGRYSERIAEKA